MIICAAVLIQVEGLDHTTIICGRRHGNCFEILRDMKFAAKTGYKEIAQGFIDHEGNFLDRYEAYIAARACGQLSRTVLWHKEDHGEAELYSEDLY
jgi:hypothetical protein